MGVILDTNLFVVAERQGESVRQMFTKLSRVLPDEEIGMSVISLMELAHGIFRADTPDRVRRRRLFVVELQNALPVYPITESIAIHAAAIDAEAKKQGNTIALPDLLIGATAVDLHYAVATANISHFKMIPLLGCFTLHW